MSSPPPDDQAARAAERLLLLEKILEHMPVAYLRLDASGRIVELEGRALERTELSLETASDIDTRDPQYWPVTAPIVADALDRGVTRVYSTSGEYGGEPWWYQNFITPSGADGGALGFIMDITDQKRAESLLKQNEQRLLEQAEELRRMNESLVAAKEAAERAREEAEHANAAKSRFLANMSHELRTPLNAIIGYAELLEEEARDDGASQTLEDLQRIHGAGHHLLGLINRVLDLARIEAGEDHAQIGEVVIAELVEDVGATVRPVVLENENSLLVTISADVGILETDGTRLRQVLFNLLSNAAKFTTRGDVCLDVIRRGATEQDDWPAGVDGGITFEVADSGRGMSESAVVKAFDDFFQEKPSGVDYATGTGLGLSITRRYVEELGGQIAIESQVGEGTVVRVWLPDSAPQRDEVAGSS